MLRNLLEGHYNSLSGGNGDGEKKNRLKKYLQEDFTKHFT